MVSITSVSPSQRPIECPSTSGSRSDACVFRSRWTTRSCFTPFVSERITTVVAVTSIVRRSGKTCSKGGDNGDPADDSPPGYLWDLLARPAEANGFNPPFAEPVAAPGMSWRTDQPERGSRKR